MKANTNPSVHAELIYGATGAIIFTQLKAKKNKFRPTLISLITRLALQGYKLTNIEDLGTLSNKDIHRLEERINSVIASTTKSAFYLCKSFGKSTELEAYTLDDWYAVLSQYSLTYGWADQYEALTGEDPSAVLDLYTGPMTDAIEFPSKTKEISIMLNKKYDDYMLSIFNSKIPLRLHQEKILQSAPYYVITGIHSLASYNIAATKCLIQSILFSHGCDPHISNLTEMQRFILNNCQQDDNGEGYNDQIFKPALKSFKFHIPTKMKKFILDWFNQRIS